MASHAEIERKYEVDAATVVPDLGTVPGVAALEPLEPVELTAVYFDTPERALVRGRIALRRRTGGYDDGWHVKLPAPEGRLELQAPIAADEDAVPERIRNAVRSRVRDAALEPIATVRTSRRPVLLKDETGTARVEVVDDEVRATDHRSGTLRSWREWEAEQVGDDPVASARMLDALEPVLLAAGARPSRSASKLAQALGALELGVPEPEHGAEPTAAEVVRGLLVELVERLHGDELAVRDGGPEAVHAMRKTVRRLRSLLGLTEVTGERGARAREELRRVSEVLAEARDAAVAARTAERLLDEVDAAGGTVPGVAEARRRLVAAKRAEAEEARVRALSAFGTPAHFRLLAGLERLADEPLQEPEALRKAADVLPDLARRASRKAGRRAARGRHDLAGLHRIRKAARRARYVIEALDEEATLARAPRLLRVARRAERLQDLLGAHRDLSVLVAELPFAAARATAEGENAYVYGVLAERAGRRLAKLLDRAGRAAHKLAAAAARAR
jgi:CHAD domain-containing protein